MDPSPPRDIVKRPLTADLMNKDLFDAMEHYYQLQNSLAFDDLCELLVGYSCRDQEGEPEDSGGTSKELARRRKKGHQLAITMRDNAAQMISSLDAIHEAMKAFNNTVVCMHPPLLESIFDVSAGEPDNLFLPAEIDVLQTFFSDVEWDKVILPMHALAKIPVKVRIERGPVKNATLRNAVSACRAYWKTAEGHSWSMSSLKHVETRRENNAAHLQGTCEQFVADVLSGCGISFTLKELCAAWTAIDRQPL